MRGMRGGYRSVDTAAMTWVFVYGTLRTGGAAEALVRAGVVERESAVLPDHALYGRRLAYPFAAPDPGSIVVGEAMRLDPRVAASVLADLDTYEGDEYRRVRRRVTLDDRQVTAHLWLVLEDHRPPEAERIPSGDWFRRDL